MALSLQRNFLLFLIISTLFINQNTHTMQSSITLAKHISKSKIGTMLIIAAAALGLYYCFGGKTQQARHQPYQPAPQPAPSDRVEQPRRARSGNQDAVNNLTREQQKALRQLQHDLKQCTSQETFWVLVASAKALYDRVGGNAHLAVINQAFRDFFQQAFNLQKSAKLDLQHIDPIEAFGTWYAQHTHENTENKRAVANQHLSTLDRNTIQYQLELDPNFSDHDLARLVQEHPLPEGQYTLVLERPHTAINQEVFAAQPDADMAQAIAASAQSAQEEEKRRKVLEENYRFQIQEAKKKSHQERKEQKISEHAATQAGIEQSLQPGQRTIFLQEAGLTSDQKQAVQNQAPTRHPTAPGGPWVTQRMNPSSATADSDWELVRPHFERLSLTRAFFQSLDKTQQQQYIQQAHKLRDLKNQSNAAHEQHQKRDRKEQERALDKPPALLATLPLVPRQDEVHYPTLLTIAPQSQSRATGEIHL